MSKLSDTLEARHYVARTNEDIKALVTQYFEAQDTVKAHRGTYLKVLVATTKAEINLPARDTPVRLKVNAEDRAIQLAALESVHKRFYAVILQTVKAMKIPPEEVNKRTTFARSYKSILRSWIKRGNSLAGLAEAKVSAHHLLPGHAEPSAFQIPKILRSIERHISKSKPDRQSRIELAEKLVEVAGELMTQAGAQPTTAMQRALRRRSVEERAAA